MWAGREEERADVEVCSAGPGGSSWSAVVDGSGGARGPAARPWLVENDRFPVASIVSLAKPFHRRTAAKAGNEPVVPSSMPG